MPEVDSGIKICTFETGNKAILISFGDIHRVVFKIHINIFSKIIFFLILGLKPRKCVWNKWNLKSLKAATVIHTSKDATAKIQADASASSAAASQSCKYFKCIIHVTIDFGMKLMVHCKNLIVNKNCFQYFQFILHKPKMLKQFKIKCEF